MSIISRATNLTSQLGKAISRKAGARFNDAAFWGTALMLTGFVATTPAFSQKINLEPMSDWSVNRIDSNAGSSAKPYCVMARRFDNNVILSIAKNDDGQKSMAIDFQTSRLATDRSYQVLLNADDRLVRGFEVRPVSDKAFVIRLGQDRPLFSALKAGSFLTVSYSGEDLRFDTSSFDSGHARLDDCLSKNDDLTVASGSALPAANVGKVERASYQAARQVASIEPASGMANAPDIIKPKVKPDSLVSTSTFIKEDSQIRRGVHNANQMRKIESLQERIQRLERENGRLSGAQDQMDMLRDELKDANAEVARLREQTAGLKEANALLRASSERSERELVARIAELRQTNREMQQDIEMYQASSDNFRLLSSQKEELTTENRFLREKLAGLEAKSMNSEARQMEIDRLTSLVSSLRSELGGVSRENEELQNALAKSQNTIQAAAGTEDMEGCLASNNWDLERATRRYQEAQREIERLGQKLRQQSERYEAEIRSVETQLFSPALASDAQNDRFVEMRKRLMRVSDELKKERVMSKRRVSMLQEKVDMLESELQMARANERRAEEKLASVRGRLQSTQDQLSSTENQIMSQRARLARVEREAERTNISGREVQHDNRNMRPSDDAGRRSSTRNGGSGSAPPVDLTHTGGAKVDSRSSVRTESDFVSSQDIINILSGKIDVAAINKLMSELNVSINGQVFKLPAGNNNKKRSYRWDTGNLLGAADVYGIDSSRQSSFNDAVIGYLNRSNSACEGEFSMIKMRHANIPPRMSLYRTMCEGDMGKTTAKSVLFIGKEDSMGVISHEALSADSPALDSIESSLARTLSGSMPAS